MTEPRVDIDAIFVAAIEIASPQEREAYLRRACGEDSRMRAQLEKLLSAHFRAGAFLESPAPGLPTEMSEAVGAGTSIGPYKLIEQLGEGGMGVVFRAEQTQPVRREVALKVIKLGMDTGQVIARFDAERQALAVMDHPNIAKVFDAGATDRGRPYFVMELVRGIPITEYCDRHNLDVMQRCELFAQVCHAVHHAHQKGLIHRDLKPSNILVGCVDDRAAAKVIDFGVAKAIHARLTEKTLFTEFHQLIGTPEYMSPEQAEGTVDVDTRSDVYSLGVLLYELLVGSPPFDPRELRSKAYAEMQRVIREVDPPTPSTRLSTMESLPSVAAHRGTEPRKLGALLRGELDWIVMKCLAKDRTRRYDAASALADDVRRFLVHEPVAAGPPSRIYRVRKFVRRHRGAVLAGSLMMLLLIAGIVGTTIGLVEARKQRNEATRANENTQAVNDFLTDQLLGAADPRVARGREVSVKEALDTAAAKVAGMFTDQPRTEAAVRNTLAVTYHSLGRADLGLPHAQAALDLRRRQLGNTDPETLESINNLGLLLRTLGRADETEALWREAVETGRRTLGPTNRKTLTWTFNLAHLVEDRGNIAEAEQMYREVLERRRTLLGDEHELTLVAQNRLGGLLMVQSRFDEAEPLLVDALEKRRRTLGSDHMDTLNSMNDLGLLRQNQKRFDECETLFREALEGYRRVLGNDHPFTLMSLNNMGTLLHKRGRPAEAEPLLRDATERSRRLAGAGHPRTLMFLANLGTTLARQNKFPEAEAMLLESDRGLASAQGVDPSRRQNIASELVKLYTAWDKSEPGQGYDLKVRQWQEKLHTSRPATSQSTRG
jgi:serine/threonine protein kinase/tetratricopeptide (TPR) repeat protein